MDCKDKSYFLKRKCNKNYFFNNIQLIEHIIVVKKEDEYYISSEISESQHFVTNDLNLPKKVLRGAEQLKTLGVCGCSHDNFS